jgi:hypothetical protein
MLFLSSLSLQLSRIVINPHSNYNIVNKVYIASFEMFVWSYPVSRDILCDGKERPGNGHCAATSHHTRDP